MFLQQKGNKMKKMTVLVPCLEGAGGIGVLRNLLWVLKEKYEITVISQLEGAMGQKFQQMGMKVQIEPDMLSETFLAQVTEADEVFANTLSMLPIVEKLNGCGKILHWWIHEPSAYFKVYKDNIKDEFWNQLNENVRVYAAGDLVHDYIKETYHYNTQVLNFGVEDIVSGQIEDAAEQSAKTVSSKVRFLLPSYYFDYIKGQDLLLKAILDLPQTFLKRSEFFFLGHVEEDMRHLYDIIQKLENAWGNVHYLPPVEHEEVLELMKTMDCLVAPSREDATNACIVEGLMLSKLCICSDMTGVSRYLEDCVSALVFPAGNVEELKKRLLLVIDSFPKLKVIGENGRKVYETVFSQRAFEKRVWELFGE